MQLCYQNGHGNKVRRLTITAQPSRKTLDSYAKIFVPHTWKLHNLCCRVALKARTSLISPSNLVLPDSSVHLGSCGVIWWTINWRTSQNDRSIIICYNRRFKKPKKIVSSNNVIRNILSSDVSKFEVWFFFLKTRPSMYLSMTSLLTHSVAHSTRPSYRPKINL